MRYSAHRRAPEPPPAAEHQPRLLQRPACRPCQATAAARRPQQRAARSPWRQPLRSRTAPCQPAAGPAAAQALCRRTCQVQSRPITAPHHRRRCPPPQTSTATSAKPPPQLPPASEAAPPTPGPRPYRSPAPQLWATCATATRRTSPPAASARPAPPPRATTPLARPSPTWTPHPHPPPQPPRSRPPQRPQPPLPVTPPALARCRRSAGRSSALRQRPSPRPLRHPRHPLLPHRCPRRTAPATAL